ncbi:hypothetical protein NQ315_005516 [Exocentrus adspersus]|uniref:N-acetyltransferase domain-containing protein n=1 Tax=Exocentrus adspersus TaxID=1586481 RepID=A0AAV8VTA4_9CUCU|nr:hypothetical protein NQ315_005516 [Exocentrus adspersus]
MMDSKVLDTSDDGQIVYVSLTPQLLEGALNVLRKGFFPHETVCTAVDLINNPGAVTELVEFCVITAKDGVSVVAVEKPTNKVVGIAFNKLQLKNYSGESSFFESYAKSCKHSSSRDLIQCMIDLDAECDLFDHCNVDCLLEVMFLGVLPEFRNKGIGRRLCEVSIKIAESLKKGENVKHALEDGQELSLEPAPQLVSALFTAAASQKIGRALGWEIAARGSYEKFFHEGKSFASVLGKHVPDATLEYVRI